MEMLEVAFFNLKDDNYAQLIEQGSIELEIDKNVDLRSINSNNNIFWTLMLHEGYLTKV